MPNIIYIILIVCFFVFGGIALYFAMRKVKNANYEEENEFSNMNRLESAFVKAGKLRENRCVMYISVFLDNYRHLYSGDKTEKVYAAIKENLRQFFSPRKNGFISTCGEYAFVVYSTLRADEVRSTVEEFNSSLTKSLADKGALNIVEVKLGLFFAVGSEVTFDEAINRARQACVLAKNEKLPYAEWDVNSGKALEKKIKIENNIESEIDNNRFFLVYQPVVDAKTKEIIGAEVLSRLNSSSEGILKPGSFLSAVDTVGLNNKFDYYIFEKNCKWISNDKEQREGYKYTINFSRSTLSDPEFVEKILDIAEKYNLNSSCLAVEVLEDKNLTEEAKKQMAENLTALKENGVSVLLDDFGSGYATFGDLQNLDISIVKIDSVITQNAVTENGYIILESIVHMAQSIGFKTLCEGVETKEQEDAAIRAGCDLLQGFYYYKPMSAVMLENLIGKEESDSNKK